MITRLVLTGSAFTAGTLLVVLDSAAKAGILFAVAAVLAACLRKSSAATRHQIWLCALTGALLMPLSFSLLPQWRVLPSWMRWEELPQLLSGENSPMKAAAGHREMAGAFAVATANDSARPIRYSPASHVKTPASALRIVRLPAAWFIGIWAAGAVLLLLPLAISAVALRWRAVRLPRLESGALVEEMESVRIKLGMRRRITLLSGGNETMPMVWGIFRCYLLLPAGAASWSSERLRSVLLHEISHLRRHDPLSLAVAHIALAIHWFNPLAWIAVRRLRIEQEHACDDSVIRNGVRSSDYASELLGVSASHQAGLAGFAASTMARSEGIESRIAGILDGSKNRRERTRAWVLGVSALAVVIAASLSILQAGEAESIVRGSILDRHGIEMAKSDEDGARRYPLHQSAAHLIGTVKMFNEGPDHLPGYLGLSGMEAAHENALRSGKNVTLTLDSHIHRIVESEMKTAGVGSGAAVILDCRNGDLLASVSMPAFDPNDFIPIISKEKLDQLEKNPASPLRDRVVSLETPGSTFKLVTALAACRTGHSKDRFTCDGFVNHGSSRMACWIWNANKGRHGELDLHGGIVNSCNCYFSQISRAVGIDSMVDTGKVLGFGQLSGSNYPDEKEGMIATLQSVPDAIPHATMMVSIGQGEVLVSPLQLAVLAAALGNGEKVWVPRLVADGPVQFRTDLLKEGWSSEDLAMIRSAMLVNVMSDKGTARAARSPLVSIAGQTGTALTTKRGKRSTVAWFVGYAPAEDPEFAIAIMVDGGASGGKVCAPIARAALEKIAIREPGMRGE